MKSQCSRYIQDTLDPTGQFPLIQFYACTRLEVAILMQTTEHSNTSYTEKSFTGLTQTSKIYLPDNMKLQLDSPNVGWSGRYFYGLSPGPEWVSYPNGGPNNIHGDDGRCIHEQNYTGIGETRAHIRRYSRCQCSYPFPSAPLLSQVRQRTIKTIKQVTPSPPFLPSPYPPPVTTPRYGTVVSLAFTRTNPPL